jgi:hypothetical protein
MLLRTTLLRVALALLAAAIIAETATARAQGPPLRPGSYDGIWHGDNVRFGVDRVDSKGGFSGRVTFAPDSNFPGYRFTYTGRIGPDGSLFVRRETGGVQIARTGPPTQQGPFLVWQGDIRGTGLDGPTPFQLTAPLPR